MNKLFTYLLPFAALCGAVAILSNRPEAASSESELPKATPNTFKVSVPSIVDRNLTDNLSADSLVQNTQVPDLRALAAASKSLLDNAQLGPQLTQLTSGLDQLKAQLDGLSKQEGSAT